MGNQGSSTKTETENISINESTIKSVMKVVQTCTSSISQEQLYRLRARGDIIIKDSNFSQNAQINAKCLLSSNKQADIKRAFVNDIMNQIETKNKKMFSMLGGGSKSATRNIIENRLRTDLTMEDVNESVETVQNTFGMDAVSVEGRIVLEGIDVEQSAEIYAETILQSKMFTSIVEDLNNVVENDVKTTDTDAMAELFSGNTIIYILLGIAGIVFLLIVLAIVIMIFKKKMVSGAMPGQGMMGMLPPMMGMQPVMQPLPQQQQSQ